MKAEAVILSAWVLVLAAALPAPLGAFPKETRFSYKEDITVGPDEVLGNIVAIGARVTVDGKVREDVFAIGGTVVIAGEVDGAVVVIGGRVHLKAGAEVMKDVVALGGTLVKETGCSIGGDTVYFKTRGLSEKIFNRGLLGFLSVSLLPIVIVLKFLSLFVWAIIVFAAASLFPKQVAFAAGEVRASPGAVLATGLLAMVAFGIAIVFAAVLSVVLIGIPILMALAFAGLIVKLFGRVAMLFFLGESLARAFHRRGVSALGGAMLGLLFLGFLSFIPILGFVFAGVVNIFGWGAAIRTRFGTRPRQIRGQTNTGTHHLSPR